jgi:hypothetical protein
MRKVNYLKVLNYDRKVLYYWRHGNGQPTANQKLTNGYPFYPCCPRARR